MKTKFYIFFLLSFFICKNSFSKDIYDNIDGFKLNIVIDNIFTSKQLNTFKFDPPNLKKHLGMNFALDKNTFQIFYGKEDRKIAMIAKVFESSSFQSCLNSRDQIIYERKSRLIFPKKSKKENRTLKNGTKTDQIYFYDNNMALKFECTQYSKNEYSGKANQSFDNMVLFREELMTRNFSNTLVNSGR